MHDNIIRAFGYEIKSPYTFIAMELCERSLHDEINEQDGIGPEALRQLIQCLKEGFKCLMEYNVVHGDVKPKNILAVNGVYKLADFGLSMFAKADEKLKMAGGSFYHCHPTVFASNYWQKIGLPEEPKILLPREIDIYSVGVTLFQAISNNVPFDALDHKSMYKLITQKEKNSIRGAEVFGRFYYTDRLPKCTLHAARKKGMAQLLVKLLKVNIHIIKYFPNFSFDTHLNFHFCLTVAQRKRNDHF